MNDEQQLKLQAFFDGELPEAEAREVAAWVARDADATALLTELRHTRQALATAELNVKLPESREFYWSRIEREIRRLEPAPEPVESPSFFDRVRRALVPASAFAVVVIIGLVATHQFRGDGVRELGTEVALADDGTGALTYRDQAEGTTLVWLSYSSENGFTEGGARDTLQQ